MRPECVVYCVSVFSMGECAVDLGWGEDGCCGCTVALQQELCGGDFSYKSSHLLELCRTVLISFTVPSLS